MKAHFFKCTNCKTLNMRVPIGNKICPVCGAVDCLEFMDKQMPIVNCTNEEILKIYTHHYKPTDSEGICCECVECGHYDNAYYELNGDDLLKDYSINSDLQKQLKYEIIENKDDKLQFYKDIKGVIYAEICSIGILENLRKLYGNDSIESYTIQILNNKMYSIQAIIPKFPEIYSIIYKDDTSEQFIKMLIKSYE